MKSYGIMQKGGNVKRISICIVAIIVFQIMIPVIGNINIVPIIYAKEIATIDGVTYTTVASGSGIVAEIRNPDVEEVKILKQFKINGNSYTVDNYRIVCSSTSSFYFKDMPNLKRLTIPAELLKKGDTTNSKLFANSNIEEIRLASYESYTELENGKPVRKERELTGDPYTVNLTNMADFHKLSKLKKVIIGKSITKVNNVFKRYEQS